MVVCGAKGKKDRSSDDNAKDNAQTDRKENHTFPLADLEETPTRHPFEEGCWRSGLVLVFER